VSHHCDIQIILKCNGTVRKYQNRCETEDRHATVSSLLVLPETPLSRPTARNQNSFASKVASLLGDDYKICIQISSFLVCYNYKTARFEELPFYNCVVLADFATYCSLSTTLLFCSKKTSTKITFIQTQRMPQIDSLNLNDIDDVCIASNMLRFFLKKEKSYLDLYL